VLIAPRPLTIRAPLDAAGNPVVQEEIERAFAAARRAYKEQKKEANLILTAR
jgi:hypothetical protein